MAETDEIVVGSLDVYLAAVDTAFPNVDTTPGVGWTKIGTAGDKNYDDDGVTVTPSQTVETFTPAGMTVPYKAYRTEEGLVIGFNLVDLSSAQFAKIMDDATAVATAAATGTPGYSTIPLLRGATVQLFALLARGTGLSPAGPTFNLQWEADRVFQSADAAEIKFTKAPSMVAVEFTALGKSDGTFVDLVIQTAAAL